MGRLRYIMASALTLAGCGDLPGFVVQQKFDTFSQAVVKNDKIDILFVVDNSGSMAEEQQNLADSFNKFIQNFSDLDLDFHIGVVSTDALVNANWWANLIFTPTPAPGGFPYAGFSHGGGPGTLLSKTGNDRYLTKTSSNYITQFQQNVKIGVYGNGAETGISSVIKTLSSDALAGYNSGFVRDGAYLSVIFVTDEDESISPSNATYIKTNTTLKAERVAEFAATLNGLKPGRSDQLRVDAVVAKSLAECPAALGVGDVYMEVAELFKGKSASVCSDFSVTLADLGQQIVKAMARFKLKQPPAGFIDVYVNNVPVLENSENGWTYDSSTQEIVFHGTSIPPLHADIQIYYVPEKPL